MNSEDDEAARFTTITYPSQKMGKEYYLGSDGIESYTDAVGFHGHFKVERVSDLAALSAVLDSYDLSRIMVHGVPKYAGADFGYVHSGKPERHMDLTKYIDIQRTKEDLIDVDGLAVCTLDSDFDTAPSWTQYLQTPRDQYNFITSVIPELKGVGLLVRPSGSNGVAHPDGTPYKRTRNFHSHFFCYGAERAAILDRLHALFAVRGYAWIMIGQSGALLERSPADMALLTNNQPVFAARPRVAAPLRNDRPAPVMQAGKVLRLSELPEANGADDVFAKLKKAPELLLRQAQVKIAYQKTKARDTLALTPRPTRAQAKTELKRQRVQAAEREKAWAGEPLGPDFVIHTMTYGQVTVEELLANPNKYHETKTRDPMEPEYRNNAQTGILYLKRQLPILVSLAHGQNKRYILEGDEGPRPFDIEQLLASKAKPERDPLNTLPQTMTLVEGSSRLYSAVRSFWTHPRKLGIRLTSGGGKTFVSMQATAEFERDFAGEMGRFTLYVAPMIKNCEEAYSYYQQCGGLDGMVFYGRSQPNPAKPDEQMCTNGEHIAHKLAHGAGERSMCEGCALRGKAQCGYDQQVQRVKSEQPSLILATHSFAHYRIPNWEPDRVIIDEALASGGVDMEVQTDALSIGSLQHIADPDILTKAAANMLGKHCDTLPDFTDLTKVMEYRYRAEVLTGIRDGKKVVWLGGKAILAKRMPYIYEHLPTMVLDGTLRRKLTEMAVGPLHEVVEIDIYRHIRVVQVIGNKFATSYITRSQRMKDSILAIAEHYPAVLTEKKIREALGKLDDPKYAHLGGSKGLNTWEAAQSAVAVLYGQPPMAALVALAEVLTGRDIEIGDEFIETRFIMMRDGSVLPSEVHGHHDEMVTDLLRHYREDQILQLVDRLRATRAKNGEKYLLFCCPVAIDLPVDAVVDFDEIFSSRYDDTLRQALTSGSGIIPVSPKQAPKFRPDLWTRANTAANHYKNWGENWHQGLEKVLIQERNGRQREVFGYRLPNMGGGFHKNILKSMPYSI